MADRQLGRLEAEGIDPCTGLLREGAVEKFLAKNRELLDALPPQVRAAVTPNRSIDTVHGRIGELNQQARLAGNQRTLAQIDPEVARLQQQAETLDNNTRLAANSRAHARSIRPSRKCTSAWASSNSASAQWRTYHTHSRQRCSQSSLPVRDTTCL